MATFVRISSSWMAGRREQGCSAFLEEGRGEGGGEASEHAGAKARAGAESEARDRARRRWASFGAFLPLFPCQWCGRVRAWALSACVCACNSSLSPPFLRGCPPSPPLPSPNRRRHRRLMGGRQTSDPFISHFLCHPLCSLAISSYSASSHHHHHRSPPPPPSSSILSA